MNTNVYTTPKSPTVKRTPPNSAGPAWWGLAIGATLFFVVAIWLLTHGTA